MARTATATRPKTADPVQARREILMRILARRPEGYVQTYAGAGPRGTDLKAVIPPDADRTPPANLDQWVDDRIWAVLGSRTRLNPGEQVYLDVCEAIRTADAATVRATVREAAKRGLSDLQAPALLMTLESLRGQAPGYANDLASVALAEARAAGWDQEPRRQRRHVTVAGRDD